MSLSASLSLRFVQFSTEAMVGAPLLVCGHRVKTQRLEMLFDVVAQLTVRFAFAGHLRLLVTKGMPWGRGRLKQRCHRSGFKVRSLTQETPVAGWGSLQRCIVPCQRAGKAMEKCAGRWGFAAFQEVRSQADGRAALSE